MNAVNTGLLVVIFLAQLVLIFVSISHRNADVDVRNMLVAQRQRNRPSRVHSDESISNPRSMRHGADPSQD